MSATVGYVAPPPVVYVPPPATATVHVAPPPPLPRRPSCMSRPRRKPAVDIPGHWVNNVWVPPTGQLSAGAGGLNSAMWPGFAASIGK